MLEVQHDGNQDYFFVPVEHQQKKAQHLSAILFRAVIDFGGRVRTSIEVTNRSGICVPVKSTNWPSMHCAAHNIILHV
jgi:hypothetical protein